MASTKVASRQPRRPLRANVRQRMLGQAGGFMIIFGYMLGR
jgi:hypothetical protein